jgi:hypothetical protein
MNINLFTMSLILIYPQRAESLFIHKELNTNLFTMSLILICPHRAEY